MAAIGKFFDTHSALRLKHHIAPHVSQPYVSSHELATMSLSSGVVGDIVRKTRPTIPYGGDPLLSTRERMRQKRYYIAGPGSIMLDQARASQPENEESLLMQSAVDVALHLATNMMLARGVSAPDSAVFGAASLVYRYALSDKVKAHTGAMLDVDIIDKRTMDLLVDGASIEIIYSIVNSLARGKTFSLTRMLIDIGVGVGGHLGAEYLGLE